MRLALYSDARDNLPKVAEVEWPKLVEALTVHDRTECAPCIGHICLKKDGKAWSPVDIEGTRANDNVRAITAAVFDLDKVTRENLLEILEILRRESLAYILHSTHSHTETTPRLRIVLAVSRPVLPKEWVHVRNAAMQWLKIPADPTTKDLARLYYLPSAPVGAEVVAESQEGKPLDVDALLSAHVEGDGRVSAASAPPPEAETNEAVDLLNIRARLKKVRRPESKALISKALGREPLAVPGERDNTVNKIASVMASACPNLDPEPALALVRESLSAMVVEPEGYQYWADRFTYSFSRARERQKESAARHTSIEAAIKKRFGETVLASPAPGEDAEDDEGSDWFEGLLWIESEDGNRKLRQCPANAEVILRCSPEWEGRLRWNEVTKAVECVGSPLATVSLPTLDVDVANWFARSEYGLILRPHDIRSQIESVARGNSYDPLKEYLRGLKWDGETRAERLLEQYFGAELVSLEGEDIAPAVRAVSERWLIGAVARALKPGCQHDNVLILEGAQGTRKSTAFGILGGEFFCDSQIALGDKDSTLLAASAWIFELAELDPLRKSEAERAKAFFSRRVDKVRPPYGRVTEDFPRRAVFVGTTNRSDYLTDETGNRRYWIVRCGTIDTAALRRDRDQLWAEAVALYETGARWWFAPEFLEDKSLIEILEGRASERVAQPEFVEAILDWWLKIPPAKRPRELSTLLISREALILNAAQSSRGVQMQIASAMKKLGFTKIRRRAAGSVRWAFVPSAELLEQPQRIDGAVVATAMIANARAN